MPNNEEFAMMTPDTSFEEMGKPIDAKMEATDAELNALLAQIKPELDATLAALPKEEEIKADEVSALEMAA